MGLMRRIARAVLAAAIIAPLAAPAGGAAAATPPDILVIAARIDGIGSLDPQESSGDAAADVLNNLYGTLVSFDPENLSEGQGFAGLTPDIAERWEISDDGRSFTFRVREGLTFASGNPVTAEDVAFSLRRAVAMGKAASAVLTRLGLSPDNMEETLQAIDAATFLLTTDRRYAPSFVLSCLATTVASVLDSELVRAHERDGDWGSGWLSANAAGSGAYRLASWKPGESYTLAANPGFWRGAPAMKRVLVRHVDASATRRVLLEQGAVDIARDLDPEDTEAVSGQGGIAVDRHPGRRIFYLSMNQRNEILADPKLREALKRLVDYEGMAALVDGGRHAVHQSFVPLGVPGALEERPYSLDAGKAKSLLGEAGNAGGFAVEIVLGPGRELAAMARSLRESFGRAGIEVSVRQGASEQLLERFRARDFDLHLGVWAPDHPDPHAGADTFAHNPDNRPEAQLIGKPAWRVAWEVPDFTRRVAEAVAEADADRRRQMYLEIQTDWQQTAPFAPMLQEVTRTARRESVEGFVAGSALTAAVYWTVTK